jgi:hypothetical protein
MTKVAKNIEVSAAANTVAADQPQVQPQAEAPQANEATEATQEQVEEHDANKTEQVTPAAEAPKRKGQTYAERKARKEAKENGTFVAGSRAVAKGPQPVYKMSDFLRIKEESGIVLREVVAIHINSIKRKDVEEANVTFAYELEGVEEPIAEEALVPTVDRVLR